MGFLNKLWDETLAGPMPDTGLEKLRKYNSFSTKRSFPATTHHHHHHQDAYDDYNENNINSNNNNDMMMITRSITILKSNSGFRSMESDSAPGSPSGSSTPGAPLSPGKPGGDFKRFMRKSSADG